MEVAKVLLLSVALFLTLGGLAGATAPSAACSACPGNVRNSLQQFCDLPFLSFLLSKPNCITMDTKNNDDMLKKKVCEPLGICGGKSIECKNCNGVYKKVLDTVCQDIDGYFLNFGIFKQTFADMCRLVVLITPMEFFNVACVKAGCVNTPPPPPPPKCPSTWGYGTSDGPSKWSCKYKACGGSKQSPVNLVTKGQPSTFISSSPFDINGFGWKSKYVRGIVSNNGHTLKFTPDDGTNYVINKKGTTEFYHLLQIHFHWGKTSDKGSEHTIDGKKYALEMHMVFKKQNIAVTEALKRADGLKVFGVLFSESSRKPRYGLFDLLQTKVAQLSKSPDQMNEKIPSTINLYYFWNKVMQRHVEYAGSLTTPGCQEVVGWMVGLNTDTVTATQLAHFRALKDENDQLLYDNFRPTQRDVTVSPVNNG